MTVHTQIFIVIYSKSPNVELKCPSTGKCISKLQYIHAMKYYSAIKKENQPQIYTITQINLRCILLSGRKVKVLDTKSDLSLFKPVDCSPPLAPLSMEFSRQEYWSGLPFPSPGDLPDPGIKPRSPTS